MGHSQDHTVDCCFVYMVAFPKSEYHLLFFPLKFISMLTVFPNLFQY